MNWFGGRIARDEIHSSIQRWFVRVFSVTILLAPALTHSNPYLVKPGEAPVSVYVSTCAVTGGFIHLYTALDQKIFEKYGTTQSMWSFAAGPMSILRRSARMKFSFSIALPIRRSREWPRGGTRRLLLLRWLDCLT